MADYTSSYTGAQIDAAVGKAHEHANADALDAVSGTNTGDQDLSGYAALASPALTGTPTAPTAANGTNTTQIATTAFVQTAVSGAGSGDMLKSVYDTDGDGKVDAAETADTLSSALAVSLGGTGGTAAAAGVYNLISALSAVTPVSADKFPFLDASGSTAGYVTLENLITALGGTKVATGSYTGTGTSGSGNPRSITTGFTTKFLLIMSVGSLHMGLLFPTISKGLFVWMNSGSFSLTVTSSSPVTWYSTTAPSGEMYQLNISGTEYDYVAIG